MTDFAYEGVRRVICDNGATFMPVCAGPAGKGGCGRFVRADRIIYFHHHAVVQKA